MVATPFTPVAVQLSSKFSGHMAIVFNLAWCFTKVAVLYTLLSAQAVRVYVGIIRWDLSLWWVSLECGSHCMGLGKVRTSIFAYVRPSKFSCSRVTPLRSTTTGVCPDRATCCLEGIICPQLWRLVFLVGLHTSLSSCWHSPDYKYVSYQGSPLGGCQLEPPWPCSGTAICITENIRLLASNQASTTKPVTTDSRSAAVAVFKRKPQTFLLWLRSRLTP